MTVNQRLIEFIGIVGENTILEKTNLKSSSLYKISAGDLKNGPRIDTLEAIVVAFPNLNESWILRGTGEIWKKVEEKSGENNTKVEEPQNIYERRKFTHDKTENLPSDIEVLKKTVELMQIEMWKLKAGMEELKKR